MNVALSCLPIKRFYKYLLKRVLGTFLRHDLELDQLDVHLYDGRIELRALELDVFSFNESLSDGNAPVRLIAARVGKLHMEIPWANILQDPCKIYLEDVYVVLVPCHTNSDAADAHGKRDPLKPRSAARSPTCHPPLLVPQAAANGGAGNNLAANTNTSPPSSRRYVYEGMEALSRLIQQIIANTEVCFKNVDVVVQMPSHTTQTHHHQHHQVPSSAPASHQASSSEGVETPTPPSLPTATTNTPAASPRDSRDDRGCLVLHVATMFAYSEAQQSRCLRIWGVTVGMVPAASGCSLSPSTIKNRQGVTTLLSACDGDAPSGMLKVKTCQRDASGGAEEGESKAGGSTTVDMDVYVPVVKAIVSYGSLGHLVRIIDALTSGEPRPYGGGERHPQRQHQHEGAVGMSRPGVGVGVGVGEEDVSASQVTSCIFHSLLEPAEVLGGPSSRPPPTHQTRVWSQLYRYFEVDATLEDQAASTNYQHHHQHQHPAPHEFPDEQPLHRADASEASPGHGERDETASSLLSPPIEWRVTLEVPGVMLVLALQDQADIHPTPMALSPLPPDKLTASCLQACVDRVHVAVAHQHHQPGTDVDAHAVDAGDAHAGEQLEVSVTCSLKGCEVHAHMLQQLPLPLPLPGGLATGQPQQQEAVPELEEEPRRPGERPSDACVTAFSGSDSVVTVTTPANMEQNDLNSMMMQSAQSITASDTQPPLHPSLATDAAVAVAAPREAAFEDTPLSVESCSLHTPLTPVTPFTSLTPTPTRSDEGLGLFRSIPPPLHPHPHPPGVMGRDHARSLSASVHPLRVDVDGRLTGSDDDFHDAVCAPMLLGSHLPPGPSRDDHHDHLANSGGDDYQTEELDKIESTDSSWTAEDAEGQEGAQEDHRGKEELDDLRGGDGRGLTGVLHGLEGREGGADDIGDEVESVSGSEEGEGESVLHSLEHQFFMAASFLEASVFGRLHTPRVMHQPPAPDADNAMMQSLIQTVRPLTASVMGRHKTPAHPCRRKRQDEDQPQPQPDAQPQAAPAAPVPPPLTHFVSEKLVVFAAVQWRPGDGEGEGHGPEVATVGPADAHVPPLLLPDASHHTWRSRIHQGKDQDRDQDGQSSLCDLKVSSRVILSSALDSAGAGERREVSRCPSVSGKSLSSASATPRQPRRAMAVVDGRVDVDMQPTVLTVSRSSIDLLRDVATRLAADVPVPVDRPGPQPEGRDGHIGTAEGTVARREESPVFVGRVVCPSLRCQLGLSVRGDEDGGQQLLVVDLAGSQLEWDSGAADAPSFHRRIKAQGAQMRVALVSSPWHPPFPRTPSPASQFTVVSLVQRGESTGMAPLSVEIFVRPSLAPPPQPDEHAAMRQSTSRLRPPRGRGASSPRNTVSGGKRHSAQDGLGGHWVDIEYGLSPLGPPQPPLSVRPTRLPLPPTALRHKGRTTRRTPLGIPSGAAHGHGLTSADGRQQSAGARAPDGTCAGGAGGVKDGESGLDLVRHRDVEVVVWLPSVEATIDERDTPLLVRVMHRFCREWGDVTSATSAVPSQTSSETYHTAVSHSPATPTPTPPSLARSPCPTPAPSSAIASPRDGPHRPLSPLPQPTMGVQVLCEQLLLDCGRTADGGCGPLAALRISKVWVRGVPGGLGATVQRAEVAVQGETILRCLHGGQVGSHGDGRGDSDDGLIPVNPLFAALGAIHGSHMDRAADASSSLDACVLSTCLSFPSSTPGDPCPPPPRIILSSANLSLCVSPSLSHSLPPLVRFATAIAHGCQPPPPQLHPQTPTSVKDEQALRGKEREAPRGAVVRLRLSKSLVLVPRWGRDELRGIVHRMKKQDDMATPAPATGRSWRRRDWSVGVWVEEAGGIADCGNGRGGPVAHPEVVKATIREAHVYLTDTTAVVRSSLSLPPTAPLPPLTLPSAHCSLPPHAHLQTLGFAHLGSVIGASSRGYVTRLDGDGDTEGDGRVVMGVDVRVSTAHVHLCTDTARSLLWVVADLTETSKNEAPSSPKSRPMPLPPAYPLVDATPPPHGEAGGAIASHAQVAARPAVSTPQASPLSHADRHMVDRNVLEGVDLHAFAPTTHQKQKQPPTTGKKQRRPPLLPTPDACSLPQAERQAEANHGGSPSRRAAAARHQLDQQQQQPRGAVRRENDAGGQLKALGMRECVIEDYVRSAEAANRSIYSTCVTYDERGAAGATERERERERVVTGGGVGEDEVTLLLLSPEQASRGRVQALQMEEKQARQQVQEAIEEQLRTSCTFTARLPPAHAHATFPDFHSVVPSATYQHQQPLTPVSEAPCPSADTNGGSDHDSGGIDANARWFVDPADVRIVDGHLGGEGEGLDGFDEASEHERLKIWYPHADCVLRCQLTFECDEVSVAFHGGTDLPPSPKTAPTDRTTPGRTDESVCVRLEHVLGRMFGFDADRRGVGGAGGDGESLSALYRRRWMWNVREVGVQDCVSSSVFQYVLCYLDDGAHRLPHATTTSPTSPGPTTGPSVDMVSVVLDELVVLSSHTSSDSGWCPNEYRVDVRVMPLRVTIDQDTLEFIAAFLEHVRMPEIVEKRASAGQESRPDDGDEQRPSRTASEELGSGGGSSPTSAAAAGAGASVLSSPLPVFIQHFFMDALLISVDYRSKRVSLSALRRGEWYELLNVLPLLEGLEVAFGRVTLRGISGLTHLGDQLAMHWMKDIDRSQVLRCLSGITPIRSLVNIGGGIADLFRTPIQHMLDTQQAPPQQVGPIAATVHGEGPGMGDARFSRNLLRGATAFLKHITVETINLTEKVVVGTQYVLETVDRQVALPNVPAYPSSRFRLPTDAVDPRALPDATQHTPEDGDRSPEDEGVSPLAHPAPPSAAPQVEPAESEQQEVCGGSEGWRSSSMNWTAVDIGAGGAFYQPTTMREGLVEHAWQNIARGVRSAADVAVTVPLLELHRSGPSVEAMEGLVRGIPLCILRPVIGATEAIASTLQGVRNELDPRIRRDRMRKYKGPSLKEPPR
ncbi:unnamed protein product [Vitrella brassicaformis CCMP3155]|uniref:Autophagy-related protein 2 n=5 Tax=Vitrella brassicaformis TaxID=1169539 RepID=A0A0G4GHX7_VITBC|nr:unnamed protein product [Vitrella brassicaformis CCMP3155]|eukprot:CEM29359.1 unnamed protein product [Vitrella brassicaformis CCMP3155]